MLTSERIREILNEHREMLEKLNSQVTSLQGQNQELILKLEFSKQQLQQAKEQVEFLKEIPRQIQTPPKERAIISLGDTQILILLYNISAVGLATAVTVTKMRQTFRLADSEKTIMRRLNDLEKQGIVEHVGRKPKQFFINEDGLRVLKKEHNRALRLESNELIPIKNI